MECQFGQPLYTRAFWRNLHLTEKKNSLGGIWRYLAVASLLKSKTKQPTQTQGLPTNSQTGSRQGLHRLGHDNRQQQRWTSVGRVSKTTQQSKAKKLQSTKYHQRDTYRSVSIADLSSSPDTPSTNDQSARMHPMMSSTSSSEFPQPMPNVLPPHLSSSGS